MPKLLSRIRDKGASFSNSFVVTPLCCPSRSSILTGKYVHNHGTMNNSISGGCSSTKWQDGPEKLTFPVLMNNGGYTTFFAGKYLNQYGKDDVGGLSYIPPGWDSWIGLKGNSVYYNYSLSINGTPIFHGDNPKEDYLTNLIKDEGLKFIEETSGSLPFLMMLSVPACHDPRTPEPKYAHFFNDSRIPETENFNIANGEDKNWFVRFGEQPLKHRVIEDIEEMYRDRLRTLMSVDDMIEAVVLALDDQNILNNTYIFFASDNGYHLGQFSLAKDKREPYEF
ncbi:UNVERIFIED_CONTAM: hypothetical protein GTU68_007952, partial [Idotea baltica]|nr:hypothetical protein [Idotea baltica]